jgi:hypothetical protein
MYLLPSPEAKGIISLPHVSTPERNATMSRDIYQENMGQNRQKDENHHTKP